jgi:hypothetical protein
MSFIILFLSISTLCYSQNSPISKPTRQLTEIWLSEKINKYLQKKDYYSIDDINLSTKISGDIKNIKLRFTNETILITKEVEERSSNKFMFDGPQFETKNFNESITIPLKDLKNKEFIKDGYLFFESSYNSFVITSSDGHKRTSNWHATRINAFEEENFTERFNKAMNHLLSFIKKSKPSELF